MVPAKSPTEATNWLPWLAGVMAVLAGFLMWDWNSEIAPPEGKPSQSVAARGTDRARPASGLPPLAPGTEGTPSVRPSASLDIDRLRDTIKRPLFERHRRPVEPLPTRAQPKPEPPAPAAQVAEADQNALTLLGVVMGEGRTVALLKRNAGGQNVRAEEGDVIDGWTIKKIQAQVVVLSQGQRQISLQLFRKQAR